MKKLKLIFGLLIVAAFIGSTVLSFTSSNELAIKKSDFRQVKRLP